MSGEALGSFVGKWQAREPEMVVATAFCPVSLRPRFQAWGALLHELREALFELSDPRVSAVKSGWWAEELLGLDQGRSRHPLTAELATLPAPWSGLARNLLDIANAEHRSGSTAEAIDRLMPAARALVSIESALFQEAADDGAARALAVHWLWSRLPSGLAMEDCARIPMHLFARHGFAPGTVAAGQADALVGDWAKELLLNSPSRPQAALYRRARTAFDRAGLERLAAGKGHASPPPLATLWRAWRAARGR